MFSYYFDPTYVLVIIAFLLTLFASMGVKSTFSKYNDVRSSRGITAASAARQILDANGLQNIRVEHVSGDLTDHYSPNENVIRLSDSTYNSTSVAAIGVAAHECGHAVQHQVGYVPIKIRSKCLQHAFNADFHNRTYTRTWQTGNGRCDTFRCGACISACNIAD